MSDRLSQDCKQLRILRHGCLFCVSHGEQARPLKDSTSESVSVVVHIATIVHAQNGHRWQPDWKQIFQVLLHDFHGQPDSVLAACLLMLAPHGRGFSRLLCRAFSCAGHSVKPRCIDLLNTAGPDGNMIVNYAAFLTFTAVRDSARSQPKSWYSRKFTPN